MKHLPSFFQKKQTINCGGQLICLSEPIVMGIINITPDSFYSGSRYENEALIVTRTKQIMSEGGVIIDIGAYSSRPHASNVPVDEEIGRLQFAIAIIKKYCPQAILSIDTFRASVVEQIYDKFGAFIVNDISAGNLDERMFTTVGKLQLPYIAMHMKGTPQTMTQETHYNNLLQDITNYFIEKLPRLYNAGVSDIILDPGFGFSKTIEQNYELLNRLDEFSVFELPLLVGVSRKSMIYRLLDTDAEHSLNGTTVLNTIALQKGADILRVHDVKEAVETVKLTAKIDYFNK